MPICGDYSDLEYMSHFENSLIQPLTEMACVRYILFTCIHEY